MSAVPGGGRRYVVFVMVLLISFIGGWSLVGLTDGLAGTENVVQTPATDDAGVQNPSSLCGDHPEKALNGIWLQHRQLRGLVL